MDLLAVVGALVLGIVAGFLVKPSTVTTTTTTLTTLVTEVVSTIMTTSVTTLLTTTTLTKLVTTTLTTLSTTTSYFLSTVLTVTTAISTTVITSTVTVISTVTNTVTTSFITPVTRTIYATTTEAVTVYPQELLKSTLPYIGSDLMVMYNTLNDLKKSYEALSSKNNSIVEKIRKAMQVRFKLVAEILNLQNDLNLLVRYYKDLIDSDKALAKLSKQELNYNNIYRGYMYLLKMKVDMAMINATLKKLGERISVLRAQMPAQDYLKVEKALGEDLGSFLLKVSKPMNALEALLLLRKAERVGGPEAIVNAYLSATIVKLNEQYGKLLNKWLEAKTYYEQEYEKYYAMFSEVPG